MIALIFIHLGVAPHLLSVLAKAICKSGAKEMKLAISSDWKKRAALAVAVVLALCGLSGALQTTSVPAAPAHVPQFAKATVRWIIVSLPDRKLALFKDGKVVKVYRVAVGKLTTPSPQRRHLGSRSSTRWSPTPSRPDCRQGCW